MEEVKSIRYLYDTDSSLELIISQNSTIFYPLHNHASVYTVGIVLDGSMILRTDHTAHIYEKNQTFVIPPYMPHSIRGNDVYSLLSLCIHKSVFQDSGYDADIIMTGITNLLGRAADSVKGYQGLICDILNGLHFSEKSFTYETAGSDAWIEQLKRQLELFPESKLSIDEMAHSALTGKYYLIRRFKQAVGLTPHQFQIQNRIRKAQRLLCETDTVTEAALTAGFCDQSHFIRQFKKLVGLTPSAYKLSVSIFKSELRNQQSAGKNLAKR